MKRKKILLTGLSFVLVAVIAIGATLAYLTSTDSDVNVMTLGNVEIDQFEMERKFDANGNVTGMQEYTQGQPLMPAVVTNGSGNEAWAPNPGVDLYYGDYIEGAVGGNGTWQHLNNVMDKFVFVKNTGESDAYYRTIIAYEAETTVTMKNDYGHDMIHFNINSHGNFEWVNVEDTTIENVEINGVKYNIMSVVYKEVLKPGEISRPSLLQVGMDQIATNEYVAQFGETFDILVLSQAVQTEGFADAKTALNTAFGETNAVNVAKWFGGVKVPVIVDKDSVKDALDEGKDVIFGDDIEMPAEESNSYGKTAIKVYKGQTLDGADNSFKAQNATDTWDSAITAYGGTIKNLTVGKGFRGIFISHITGDQGEKCGLVTFENVVIDGPVYTFNCDQGTNNGLKAIDSTFNGWTSYAATLGNVEFINCNFGYGAGYSFCRPYAPTTFVGCEFEEGFEMDPRAAVVFENCTLNGVAITADNLSALVTSNIANATVK